MFGETSASTVAEVHQNWETIKAEEKGESPQTVPQLSRKLDRYNSTLPPLMASLKMSEKAAAAGFEWENIGEVWAKFEEELQEFREALQTENKAHQQAELGDLLFTVVNLARWYDLDPNGALHGTNNRMVQRISLMEKLADKYLTDYSLAELETLWQRAKQHLHQSIDSSD